MNSSRYNELITIYSSHYTVFTLPMVAMLTDFKEDTSVLVKRLNYQVQKGRLLNPRRGIYAKPGYRAEELCNRLYRPSYISLEYVLQRAGVAFQYDSSITAVSYLSRDVEVDGNTFRYRKIKGAVLCQDAGIVQKDGYSIATPERALLDLMYLNKQREFDNLYILSYKKTREILPIYGSKTLEREVNKLFKQN